MIREMYWNNGNPRDTATDLLDAVLPFAHHHGLEFRVSRAALLVLDLQEFFLDSRSHAFVPGAPPLLPGILESLRIFRGAGRPVLATRHLDDPRHPGMMARWWRHPLLRENPASQLVKTLRTEFPRALEKQITMLSWKRTWRMSCAGLG